MKIGQVVRSLASGTALYVVMAACGASDRAGGAATADGGSGDLDAERIVDAFVDELGNPVGDAVAGPLPPDVATEACDKPGTLGPSMTAAVFAVHHYPGKTVEDLSAVRVVLPLAPASQYTVGGELFDRQAYTGGVLRQGAVAVYCGAPGAPIYTSVTFILP